MKTNFEELRNYFKEKEITQREISQAMGVTPAYVNSIFTGKRSVGKKNAEKLEQLYGISATWLLTGEGPMLLSDVDIHGDHNAVAGRDASVSVTDAGIIEKFLAEIAEQRKLTEAQQRLMGAIQGQVDRLLGIIEEMTKRMG